MNTINTMQPLEDEAAFEKLCASKTQHYFFIFKHSSICPVSFTARDEVQKYLGLEKEPKLPVYELEVRKQRPLSNLISEQFNIPHESPQLILVKDGTTPLWDNSHFFITEENIVNAISQNQI